MGNTCCSGGPTGSTPDEVNLNRNQPATPADKIFEEHDTGNETANPSEKPRTHQLN